MGANPEASADLCRVSVSDHDRLVGSSTACGSQGGTHRRQENPRYLVTSLSAEIWPAQKLYEELYCARGDMENRIKEQFTLFADRVSAASLRANQLRMYLSAMAYVLVCGLRRLGLRATELANAQAATIRLR